MFKNLCQSLRDLYGECDAKAKGIRRESSHPRMRRRSVQRHLKSGSVRAFKTGNHAVLSQGIHLASLTNSNELLPHLEVPSTGSLAIACSVVFLSFVIGWAKDI
jgi:hypothetical protein